MIVEKILLLLFATTIVAVQSADHRDFGIIIDAGSSGSRVHVYSWEEGSWNVGQEGNLPEITEDYNKKIKPGISSFGSDLAGIDTYIISLIDEAKAVVPAYKHRETRIYLFATAGKIIFFSNFMF